MQALLRYPKHKRRAIAQEWARRSNAVLAKMRMECEPDCETQRFRALHDAKGQVLRDGCTYSAQNETRWVLRRSTLGRVNQLDLVADGKVVKTCGKRKMPSRFRP